MTTTKSKREQSCHKSRATYTSGQEKEKSKNFGIKQELYRPFQAVLNSLSFFYNLKEKSTFGRISELVDLNVFSVQGGKNLKQALDQVFSLRLQAHFFYKNEKEILKHIEDGKIQDSCLLYLDEKLLPLLHQIYMVLIPFHRCGKKFLSTKNQKDFIKSTFYDASPSVKGDAFERTLQYITGSK